MKTPKKADKARKGPKSDPFVEHRQGRPFSIIPDEETLKKVRGLARIQATKEEAAAVFGIALSTFYQFLKDWPEAAEAWDSGAAEGKASLRRTQFKLAEKNAQMAIFLGKNYLGQTDKLESTHKGDIAINIDSEDADV